MRLIMMGTGSFAAPTFEGLFDTHHEIVALFTSPTVQQRSRSKVETPMRDIAVRHALPIFDPPDINSQESLELLRSFHADLFIVCDFGYILSPATLATAQLGGVNLHCSLLPKYRGAAPINWTLYNGDHETGISVIHMTPKVDAGPVIAQSPPMPIAPEETAVELKERLADLGKMYVISAIESIEAGKLHPINQDPNLVSRAPKLKKEHGHIDWNRTARQVVDHYRAMQPWPKTFTFWQHEDKEPLRLIVGPICMAECHFASPTTPPGTVIFTEKNQLVVATGEGAVELLMVQPSGKRLMTGAEFMRGYPIREGDLLI